MVARVTRKAYRALATRGRRTGGWWAIEVPEIPGVFSQARRLDRVEAMARDAIALMRDVDPMSFDVTVEPHLDEETERLITTARNLRHAVEVEQIMASQATRAAARALIEEGLTVRDVGQLLGVTHQRVAQLLATQARAMQEPRVDPSQLVDLQAALAASVSAARPRQTEATAAKHAASRPVRRVAPSRAG